ncbi:hypothetical protein BCV72DRAFT_331613 [Rhizopus microsporus var. microsporus]|uniref:Tc1-like transposase DDE domain-containing protein n=1 Tax=Rhizopus microsporus var. microsporus TaxID=86635 RepID=A0A1X0QZJ9_RHIZD|nr:hypothetical protein BCV72DRAFT_331613 [Rhizopus microsporus var. microsporus]
MIWSCFHANGFGPLILIDGTVDQDKYINILAQNYHSWDFKYWPAQSPDLNPTEYVWIALGNLIKERRSEIRNIEELSVALREELEKISPGLAAYLVGSMKARCEAVIAAKGGLTKY